MHLCRSEPRTLMVGTAARGHKTPSGRRAKKTWEPYFTKPLYFSFFNVSVPEEKDKSHSHDGFAK